MAGRTNSVTAATLIRSLGNRIGSRSSLAAQSNASGALCYNSRVLKIAAGAVWTVTCLMVQGPVQSPVQSAGSVQGSTAASTGVYAEAQAERGKTAFATYCTGCHTVASQSGESFSKKWNGATVADLYKVLTEDMPKD